MLEPLSISFIIPFYHIPRPLLQACLRSVQALDASGSWLKWEAWIIDDGTPNSLCEQWINELADARFHYHHQANGGLSAARNAGIALARYDYLHFLDSDDHLNPAAAIAALRLLAKERPDVLKFSFEKCFYNASSATSNLKKSANLHTALLENDNADDTAKAPTSSVTFSGSGADFLLTHNLQAAAWSYFVRRTAIGSLRFTPGTLHEDEEFTPQLLAPLRHIIVTSLPAYCYLQRDGSIMHPNSAERLTRSFADLRSVMTRLAAAAQSFQATDAHHAPCRRALLRRLSALRLDYAYNLLMRSPSVTFLNTHLAAAHTLGHYPPRPISPTPRQRLLSAFLSRPFILRTLFLLRRTLRFK